MQLIEYLMLWVFILVVVVVIMLCCLAVLVHMVCRQSRDIANLRENTIDAFRVVTHSVGK